MPSRKWFAATVTGLGAIATLAIQSGTGEAFQIALVGFIVERAVAYLTPNAAR